MSNKQEPPPLRVVIAEDSVLTALDLERLVTEEGHQVVAIVATGPAAAEAARQHRPDLVLMDIRLAAGTDGMDTACTIREELGIPSVFVTGSGEPETRARADAVGHLGFLTKPFTAHRLRDALVRAGDALGRRDRS